MDTLDVAVVYGVGGGILAAVLNYAFKGSPTLTFEQHAKYYALFASMGCIGGALAFSILSSEQFLPSGFDATNTGFAGGFIGSFGLLAVANTLA